MIYVVIVLMVLLQSMTGWLLVKCLKKNLELADQREGIVDTIETSLDILDEVYTRIAHAATIPVLSDEPVVRELLNDIKRAKNAVLAIANMVVIYGNEPGEKDED